MTLRLDARSMSPLAAEAIAGPRKEGAAIGTRYALVGDRVLALTPPGALRMPNGIEADVALSAGERVIVGGGELRTAAVAVGPGPLWNPRPRPRAVLSVSPRIRIEPRLLAGRGPGLTPLGDDILVGYLAGAALAGTDVREVAETAACRTTTLSATLLRLAAHGFLPEAAHRLLEDGDLRPLLHFGATSGTGIAVGLGLASRAAVTGGSTVVLTLPLPDGETRFELSVAAHPARRALLHDPAIEPEGSAYACMSSRR